jgi:quercetin dioxygenase-like cupin family protein
MKHTILSAFCFLGFCAYGNSQHGGVVKDTMRTILENDKLKVVEYISTPGKDACGKGLHSHAPHLTILLTDASIRLTTKDGKEQDFELSAGFTLWSEAETHMAINNGGRPVKAYLVEIK